jgi:hypothetical protein
MQNIYGRRSQGFRAVVACAVLLTAAVPVGPALAQARREPAPASGQREAAAAKAAMARALERSRGDRRFVQASSKRDTATMARILVANGAPGDIRVVSSPSGGAALKGGTFECCSKKSWGPVIIRW